MEHNKIWLVTLRTNVSTDNILSVKEGNEAYAFWGFTSFEKAKENMEKLISAYANTPNKIFDGQGLCTDFKEYMDEAVANLDIDPYEPEEVDETYLALVESHGGYCDRTVNFREAEKLPEILKSYLTDIKGFSPKAIPTNTWTDYLMGCKSSPDLLFIEGVDDGPCNGINPYFYINTFNMDNPEKNYKFHIRSTFYDDWDSIPGFIYIDLVCSDIDAELTFPIP